MLFSNVPGRSWIAQASHGRVYQKHRRSQGSVPHVVNDDYAKRNANLSTRHGSRCLKKKSCPRSTTSKQNIHVCHRVFPCHVLWFRCKIDTVTAALASTCTFKEYHHIRTSGNPSGALKAILEPKQSYGASRNVKCPKSSLTGPHMVRANHFGTRIEVCLIVIALYTSSDLRV